MGFIDYEVDGQVGIITINRPKALNCLLYTSSWSWSRFQGLGCSPIKAVRELGSERRETVRSLSLIHI